MPRSRDNKGRFIKTPRPKTNLPPGAEPLGKIEHTTPAKEVTIQKLEDKHKSSQILTLIERQILLAHESQKKHLLESSTKRESRKITQQSLEQLFGTSDTEQAIKSPEESIKMAEEGGGSARRPTLEQQKDQREEE